MDANLGIREAIEEIRQAVRDLRENVVQALTRRNQAQTALSKLEDRKSELLKSLELAQNLHRDAIADEYRADLKKCLIEIELAKKFVSQVEAQVDAAKNMQSQEEARLQQIAVELQGRLVVQLGSEVERKAIDPGVGWERAQSKASELEARAELAQTPVLPERHDENADRMLADLEKRLTEATGMTAQQLEIRSFKAGKYAVSKPESASLPAFANLLAPSSGSVQDVQNSTDAQINTVLQTPVVKTSSASLRTSSFSAKSVEFKGETLRMERVKVAAIGTGGIFRGAHLPCYPDIPKAKMAAFCDPDPIAQKAVMKRFEELTNARIEKVGADVDEVDRLKRDLDEVKVYSDISEIIAEVKPDLVDICTLPMLHAPLAIQALEAGINVMCEKPVSRSWLESQKLIEVVKRTGKFYQHNENWLFDPDYYTVKKLVDSGAIGELVMMFLTQAHGGPEGNHRFWNSDFGGGGSLLDNGIHAIGAVWFITGLEKTPTTVKAAEPFGMTIRMPDRIIDGRYQKVNVDDDAHILIRFEDSKTGAWSTAHVEGSWSHQDSPDTVYIGTTGRIEMKNEEGKRYAAVIDAYGNEARKIQVSGMTWSHWPSSFYGEIQNMVMCVMNNEQSIMTAEFGADCSAIVGAAYLSQLDGKRAVPVEEFRQFARGIAAKYPNDPKAADNALVDALLAAVRK